MLGNVYFAFIRIASDGIFRFSETTCRCDQLVCGLIYRNALVFTKKGIISQSSAKGRTAFSILPQRFVYGYQSLRTNRVFIL